MNLKRPDDESSPSPSAAPCAEFEAGLNDLLDRRQPLELEGPLADHAAACGECRALFAAYGGVARIVATAPLPKPPADLAERVLCAWRADRSPVVATSGGAQPRRHALTWRIAAAAACVVLVALMVPAAWQLGPALFGERDLVVTEPEENAEPDNTIPGGVVQPARASIARQTADCYAELAHETGKDLTDVMALMPDLSHSAVARVLPPAQQTTAVAADVASGLQPLTDSTAGAVSFLMDVLPGGREL